MKLFKYSVAVLSAVVALGALFSGQLKSGTSQMLMTHAWERTLETGEKTRAWPWLESYPVAKLNITGQDPLIVMSGEDSVVMHYAPIWHEGSVMPGEDGVSFIRGDRRAHFSVLKMLSPGDRFEVLTTAGEVLTYQIDDIRVADKNGIDLQNTPDESVLILMASYPVRNLPASAEGQMTMNLVAISRKLDGPISLKMAEL